METVPDCRRRFSKNHTHCSEGRATTSPSSLPSPRWRRGGSQEAQAESHHHGHRGGDRKSPAAKASPLQVGTRQKPKGYSHATMAQRPGAGRVHHPLLCLPTAGWGGGGGSRQRSPPVLSCSSHDKTALSPRQYIPTASPGSPSRPLSTGGLSTSPEIAHASFLEDEKTPVHLCTQPHTTFSWSSLELGAMYLHMTLVDWPIC